MIPLVPSGQQRPFVRMEIIRPRSKGAGQSRCCLIVYVTIPGTSLSQLQELSNHWRRIATSRRDAQRSFELRDTLEATKRHALDIDVLQRGCDDGDTETSSDQIQSR